MPFETTPCTSWTEVADVISCPPYTMLDPVVVAEKTLVASDLLFQLSGQRFIGDCPQVVRPLTSCDPCDAWPYGSEWFTWVSEGHAFVFDTDIWPVRQPISVLINGAPMVDFKVIDGRWLVRTDGLSWPSVQLSHLPSTEQGTWQISFTYGEPLPPSGELAARVLTGELSLSCSDDDDLCKKCRLSRRVQQVTRNGMSLTLLDPFQFLDKGRLGILEIDAFITAYNPNGLMGEPVVASASRNRGMIRQTYP